MENTGLLLFIILGLVIWFWYDTLAAREHATRSAREICHLQGLQLLDASVALQRVRLQRSGTGRLVLQRTFQFGYSSDGYQRMTGFVITLGNRVEQVGL
jgi:hypothetical protein